MDGLCVFFGAFVPRVKRRIFWAIDFVPSNRFASLIKNFIYRLINIYSYKNADEVWDLSPRMYEARKKYLNIQKQPNQVQRLVPYGAWLEEIKVYSYEECEKNTLVFMGHLIEKQGVQFVLSAMPEILKVNSNFKFKIIGDGSFAPNLKRLVGDLGLEGNCVFMGKVPNNQHDRVLIPEIAKSCVAIAPYVNELDTWTYYADPGKVKLYLACGVPVVLTDLPWNSKEIESLGCGLVTTGAPDDIAQKVLALMDKHTNDTYRENTRKYAKKFDYSTIFESIKI
jgi:glycosyltransferase involved in cell wall biosynthesis